MVVLTLRTPDEPTASEEHDAACSPGRGLLGRLLLGRRLLRRRLLRRRLLGRRLLGADFLAPDFFVAPCVDFFAAALLGQRASAGRRARAPAPVVVRSSSPSPAPPPPRIADPDRRRQRLDPALDVVEPLGQRRHLLGDLRLHERRDPLGRLAAADQQRLHQLLGVPAADVAGLDEALTNASACCLDISVNCAPASM